jgi:YesN/AraC family two-component response regulator
VVGEATKGREAVGPADTLDPDVVMMDIRMPVFDGTKSTASGCAITRHRG